MDPAKRFLNGLNHFSTKTSILQDLQFEKDVLKISDKKMIFFLTISSKKLFLQKFKPINRCIGH